MMLRKVALVLVRAFFPAVPALQAALVCTILTISLATQVLRTGSASPPPCYQPLARG